MGDLVVLDFGERVRRSDDLPLVGKDEEERGLIDRSHDGVDHLALGRFDKSIEVLDKAIRASPSDPSLTYYYGNKAWANFGLKRYDETIELARRAIAINPYNPYANVVLVAALALTGHDA